MVMVNALIVNPVSNPVMLGLWIGAGLIGGIIARTKAGGFVVGFFVWISCLVILVFSLFQMMTAGIDLGTMPPIPPGSSILDVLSIPVVQDVMGQLLPLVSGGGGSIGSPMDLLAPLIAYFVIPPVTIIISAIIGATIRQKVMSNEY